MKLPEELLLSPPPQDPKQTPRQTLVANPRSTPRVVPTKVQEKDKGPIWSAEENASLAKFDDPEIVKLRNELKAKLCPPESPSSQPPTKSKT